MYNIFILNQISDKGLNRFPAGQYHISKDLRDYDAIIVRSSSLHDMEFSPNLKAVARAGAGVNNVPVAKLSELGIPVFNTPGANANAVKELVLSGMLLASRGIMEGINYVRENGSKMTTEEFNKALEKEKKRFKGTELAGKTLGVVGLGAIGSMVAELGLALGMKVFGYDPMLSVDSAWRLPREVKRAVDLKSMVTRCDYVSLHLPAIAETKNLINSDVLDAFKFGGVLLNYARGAIVDSKAIVDALSSGRLGRYVADFPDATMLDSKKVIFTPHLGASTDEAEENCAVMAVDEIRDFLENGNIVNSVNFPNTYLDRTGKRRIVLTNTNVAKVLGHVLSELSEQNVNVTDMINKSMGEIAYNIIDIDDNEVKDLEGILKAIDGVINVRML